MEVMEKLKNFYIKRFIKRMKMYMIKWGEIVLNYIFNKWLEMRLYKEL